MWLKAAPTYPSQGLMSSFPAVFPFCFYRRSESYRQATPAVGEERSPRGNQMSGSLHIQSEQADTDTSTSDKEGDIFHICFELESFRAVVLKHLILIIFYWNLYSTEFSSFASLWFFVFLVCCVLRRGIRGWYTLVKLFLCTLQKRNEEGAGRHAWSIVIWC